MTDKRSTGLTIVFLKTVAGTKTLITAPFGLRLVPAIILNGYQQLALRNAATISGQIFQDVKTTPNIVVRRVGLDGVIALATCAMTKKTAETIVSTSLPRWVVTKIQSNIPEVWLSIVASPVVFVLALVLLKYHQ